MLEEVVRVVDAWSVRRQGVFDGEHSRQWLVLDDDPLYCLARDLLGVSGDDRDGIGKAADLVLGEHALIEHGDAITIGTRHVFVREHRMHAGQRARRRRVDRADVRMRVSAPQDARVEHAGHRHVAGVEHLAGDLLPGIQARRRGADQALFGLGVDGNHAVLRAGAGTSAARMVSAAERTAAVILL